MLYASVKLPHIQYQDLDQEEIAELEVTEKGVSLMIFREQSCEIIFKTYFLLEKYYGSEGTDIVLQMILRTLQEGNKDA